jgi:hypothetical protein
MKKLLILISSFALLNCANPKSDKQAEFLEIQFKLTSSALTIGSVEDSKTLSVCVDDMKICDDEFQILRLPEGDFYGKKVPGTTCLNFDLGNAFDLVTWEDFVILNICF